MTIRTGRKLGFFASLAMLIGTVVGIGIFFKTHGILRTNNWNGVGTLLSWLLGGCLSLAAAISFSEIGRIKTKNVVGLPGYAEILVNKKFGYFTRFNYSIFYFGILSVVLGFFGSEIIVGMVASWIPNFSVRDVPIYAHVFIAVFISFFFMIMNFLSLRTSGIVQSVTTIMKWIPLIMVAFLGIVFATTNHNAVALKNGDGSPLFGHNAFSNGQPFSFTKMLAALPAVLFAYDAFLCVLSLKDKVKDEEKRMPFVILVGMLSVIVLYSFIALSAILHGSGMVSGAPFSAPPEAGLGIFDQIFTSRTAMVIGKLVIAFLVVSTLGVINGISASAIVSFEQLVKTNSVFGTKTLKFKFGEKKTIFIIVGIILLFWSLVIYTPAIILNSDSIVDGASNFPTLFFFAIYAIIILKYLLTRKTYSHRKMNNILFKIFGWIAVVGILFVVLYQFVYGFFLNAILNPNTITHWGLYLGDDKPPNVAFPTGRFFGLTLAQGAIILTTYTTLFFVLPLLNKILTNKFENNKVVIDTQNL